MSQRWRHICFTLNNYTEDEVNYLKYEIECEYIIFQQETGGEGTKHLQGFVSFKNPRTLFGVKQLIGRRAYLDKMRGNIDQVVSYCSKEVTRDPNTSPFERGTKPANAGRPGGRSDLEAVCRTIATGASKRIIAEKHGPEFIKYHRGIDAYRNVIREKGPRRHKTEVHWFWGATGTGKSLSASTCAPDAYWKSANGKWWDGYEGQDDVIIDDYRVDFCKFNELLRLFDRYPLKVEVKGGYVEFVSKRIFITCPNHPSDVWDSLTEEDVGQLFRRIEHIKSFPVNP